MKIMDELFLASVKFIDAVAEIGEESERASDTELSGANKPVAPQAGHPTPQARAARLPRGGGRDSRFTYR